jgi:hypothetical protein
MNGEPKRAETMLRQAAATDRGSLKIRQNLALVLGLQGKYDEAKLLASRDLSAESAAENTDYLRRIVKLEKEVPPTSDATRAVATAPVNPKIIEAVEGADMETDPVAETVVPSKPVRTSRRQAVSAVQTVQSGELLRGTVLPAGAPDETEIAQSPSEVFSVAQWTPIPQVGAEGTDKSTAGPSK